nr:tyrosine-type recombinase/integrase [Sphingomonas populi]
MKYRAAPGVAYGAGLRVSEVAHLKADDIDSKRMLIRIEEGKRRPPKQVRPRPRYYHWHNLFDAQRGLSCGDFIARCWLYHARNQREDRRPNLGLSR